MSQNLHIFTSESAQVTELSPKKAGEPIGEEIMGLARNIFASTMGHELRQIVFCGVDRENGSSAVAASTARALVEMGATSVCLVDGNVRAQNLSRAFGVALPRPFSGKAVSVLEQCLLIGDKLWLAGTELVVDEREALLQGGELNHLLEQLRDIFEFVVIDAPALGVCGDAVVFGQVAGAAVLVIEADRTRKQTARRAKDTLEAAGVRLLGAVLRNRSFPLPERLFRRL